MTRFLLPLLLIARLAAAQDMIPPTSIQNHGPIGDVLDWPVTCVITRITMSPEQGFAFESPCRSKWPDYLAFGNDGYLQYTVWPVVNVNGSWHTAGEIQFWRDRPSSGGFGLPSWHDDFPANWGYNAPVLRDYHPNVGDRFGFFLTAGNGRLGQVTGVTSVRERSTIVVITLPQGDRGSWTFDAAPPVVQPPDAPPPVVTPPQNSGDFDALLELIGELDAKLSAIQAQQAKDRADVLALVEKLSKDVDAQKPNTIVELLKFLLLGAGAYGAGK